MTAALAATLAVVLIGGYVLLTTANASTAGYVLFVSSPLVSGIVTAFLAKKVDRIQSTTDSIEKHTNGLMSGRFGSIDSQLRSAHRERAAMDGYQGKGADPDPAAPGAAQTTPGTPGQA